MSALSKFFRKMLVNLLCSNDKKNRFFTDYINAVSIRKRDEYVKLVGDYRPLLELFSDQASKDCYERETYSKFFPNHTELAAMLSPCTRITWENAYEKAGQMLRDGEFPVLCCQHDNYLQTITASNVVLNQYEYPPYVTINSDDVIIDGGGFIGDTAIWAIKKNAKTIYSFEPNEKNMLYFNKNIKKFGNENIKLIPFGIGSEVGKVFFEYQEDTPQAARITKNTVSTKKKNVSSINIVDLDSWCEENSVIPTYIKIDIEGAEVDALRGAEKTIRKYKPKLAVCIYHEKEHMIKIPQIVKSYCPEYRLWCKKSHMLADCVLFASV